MLGRSCLIILASVLALSLPRQASAQEPATSPAVAEMLPPGVESSDPAAATKAWLDSVPADKRAKSDAYFEGGYWLILWNFLVTAAILILLLVSGVSVRLRNFAEQTFSLRPLQTACYGISFLLILTVLSFPLTVYQDFVRDHAYG